MRSERRALVIGGGVAGSTTALALKKAGIAGTIYEARSEGGDTAGIMLTLGSNGIDALSAIEADDPVRDLGFRTDSIGLRTHTGMALGRSTLGTSTPGRPASRTMRRADLNAALLQHAVDGGVPVERGRRLVSVEERPDKVVATFDDGGTTEADVLVGADGVHSVVRRMIDQSAPSPRFSGLVTTGGYARGVPVAIEPGTYEMIFGRRGFFGFALPPDDESVWWFVNLPRRREPARGELAAVTTDQWRKRFAEVFADDSGPALDLIAATGDFAPMTPIHTVPPLRRWHTDRMVIVGDAAHAPSPTSGQGASLAIEDAVVLARALRDESRVDAAFTAFASARRPRVEKIVKAAARVNNNKAAGPVGRILRDALLPSILRATANSNATREVYDHHLEWDERTQFSRTRR